MGAQVAPTMFLHQPLPGRFRDAPQHMARKRDLAGWQSAAAAAAAFQQHHQHQQYQQQQQPLEAVPYPSNPGASWNCKMWDWDSRLFVARPAPTAAAAADGSDGAPLRLGNHQAPASAAADSDPRNKGDEPASAAKATAGTSNITTEDDGGGLTLKLGGNPFSAAAATAAAAVTAEDAAARPNKRVRSGSPGAAAANYPMCQVDDCKADLSSAKDYHRRHKVCELHSKTTKALVGKQMQRFCQQCSRFHPLSEFDEGKRSCRRRLAGHNRRRRKTQPEDTSSRLLPPANKETNANANLDLVNILSILARLQGNLEKATNNGSLPDKDRLINIINKINSAPPPPAPNTKTQAPGGFDLNVPQTPPPSEQQPPKPTVSAASPPTLDLLAALSAALKPAGSDNTGSPSHGSSDISADDRLKANSTEPMMMDVVSPETGRRDGIFPSSLKIAENSVQELRSTLQLQLFGSSAEDDSPPKASYARKYLSSESSNPMDDNRSPSSSPPVVRKFFPVRADAERDECRERTTAMVEASASHYWSSVSVMKDSERGAQAQTIRNLPYHAGYTSSSSASDHSPSSSNSDAHDRTGRIVFKLFDKNPNDLPGGLRSQILNWLSHIPSEMESYIRPGCVVLSLYVSMPSIVWDEFQEDLFHRIQLLLQSTETDFWRSGRFLVQTDRQLASHKDGRIRLSKTWKSWSSPEVMSVSPLAVVSGKDVSLTLKGRNLTMPGTRIHCTYMGGYTSKEIVGSAYPGTVYDDSSVESFDFPAGPADAFGRCFVEVENGFKGNSFPIIVAADSSICKEINLLQSELENSRTSEVIAENGRPRSREDIIHFLNELGWLFQRRNMQSPSRFHDFSCLRFKYLLTFTVERDWSALMRQILDILVERSSGNDNLATETLEALLEIQLLSRAVKRKCRAMVDLLLNYSVASGGADAASRFYPFVPNQVGPGGLTPLHLAASTLESEDMVDALTNDPQQIGLKSWDSCTDDSGQSPYDYAVTRNNHSYNKLVARKLSDRKNHQVSITVEDKEEISLDRSWIVKTPSPDGAVIRAPPLSSSCSKCATLEHLRSKGIVRSRGLLNRPYIHSMLAIAAVCVCVCLFLRGLPQLDNIAPFKWENLDYGPR